MRLFTKLIDALPQGTRLPVLSGPLRGHWWTLSHHRYHDPVNQDGDVRDYGYISGRYERETQRALWALIKPGSVFFDIGAHHGFFSALALRRRAIVYAFEKDEESCRSIRRNVCGVDVSVMVGDIRRTIDNFWLPKPNVVKIDLDDDELSSWVVQRLYARWPRIQTILVKD